MQLFNCKLKVDNGQNWEASLTVHADVGLPAVSEPLMGVREVKSMVQLVLCMLAEPYGKSVPQFVTIY